jgi:hypothetical protein
MTPFRVVQPTKEVGRLVPEAACGQAFRCRFEPLSDALRPRKNQRLFGWGTAVPARSRPAFLRQGACFTPPVLRARARSLAGTTHLCTWVFDATP